jgi:hypothetical protein
MIWDLWRRREGSILVPGHDLPMTQKDGRISYIGKREAALKVWFGEDIETTTLIDLTGALRHPRRRKTKTAPRRRRLRRT